MSHSRRIRLKNFCPNSMCSSRSYLQHSHVGLEMAHWRNISLTLSMTSSPYETFNQSWEHVFQHADAEKKLLVVRGKYRLEPTHMLMLQVSALHYSAGSQVSEGFWTVASAHALHQPTIAGPSISIINVHKFGT